MQRKAKRTAHMEVNKEDGTTSERRVTREEAFEAETRFALVYEVMEEGGGDI